MVPHLVKLFALIFMIIVTLIIGLLFGLLYRVSIRLGYITKKIPFISGFDCFSHKLSNGQEGRQFYCR